LDLAQLKLSAEERQPMVFYEQGARQGCVDAFQECPAGQIGVGQPNREGRQQRYQDKAATEGEKDDFQFLMHLPERVGSMPGPASARRSTIMKKTGHLAPPESDTR
jgi:hypothetical protein